VKTIRVFPRRTKATPDDADVRIATDPGLFDEADEVHVSVSFTWDLPLAERLEKAWRSVATVKVGGPATGQRGEIFTPGLYLKKGYVITSRGCPNRCWFCSVWKREGGIRELPITEGWNVLDDNLLACSEGHIRTVFSMLKKQKHPVEFTGGLEARILQSWHVRELVELKPKQMFFAYDTPDDAEPLAAAGKLFTDAGYDSKRSHALRCFVLVGYPRDTMEDAERRLKFALEVGFTPMAMLYRGQSGKTELAWRQFQRSWARPCAIYAKTKVSPGVVRVTIAPEM